MKSPSIFNLFLYVAVLFLVGCNGNSSTDNYISEDSLELYKKRDSLLNELALKLNKVQQKKAVVTWSGKSNCNYLIIKTAEWWFVVENNYAGGIYENDQLEGIFPGHGNMQAQNLTSNSTANLFIVDYYSTASSALQSVKIRCHLDDAAINN